MSQSDSRGAALVLVATPIGNLGDLSARAIAELTTADVMALMRDHYEGTEFNMSKGFDSGPYDVPIRWRPFSFRVDGVDYSWERPISTQQSAFTMVTQSRDWP